MKQALNNIVFIQFAYIMTKWKLNVYRGIINETNYNKQWSKLKFDFFFWIYFCYMIIFLIQKTGKNI